MKSETANYKGSTVVTNETQYENEKEALMIMWVYIWNKLKCKVK